MIEVGDYVIHKTKSEEWGIGKVIEKAGTTKAPRITIFFTRIGGSKTFATLAPFIAVDENDVSDADKIQLDNIHDTKPNAARQYLSIPDAIIGFKKLLNIVDFNDEKYFKIERDYKLNLHTKMVEYFSKEELHKLLNEDAYDELMERLQKIFVAQINLLSHFEYIKLKDELMLSDYNKKMFFEALYNVLYGDNFEDDFRDWINVLSELKHAKWTLATIFLYARFPDKYMFVKPDTTRVAAEISNFFINYDSRPTIDGYKRILAFSNYLFMKIVHLHPKDMIDVQSFMWYMNPKTVTAVIQYKEENPNYWDEF